MEINFSKDVKADFNMKGLNNSQTYIYGTPCSSSFGGLSRYDNIEWWGKSGSC
jgi:hypothetical protein